MTSRLGLKGKRALVTGASSGLGVEFARQLAARGANLVVTARRTDRLLALAAELRGAFGVTVDVIPLDLSQGDAPLRLFEMTEGKGASVDILINNAGFGTKGPFVEIPWPRTAEQLQLNVVSLTQLTHLFVGAMRARNAGHVLNIASIGAFVPTPTLATYAAGKAYVRSFSEALSLELRATNVRVCCLSPGGTETEFAGSAGMVLAPWIQRTFMSPERCAKIGLAALFRGRHSIVSGFMNSAMMFLLRFVPRRMAALIAERVF